MNYLPCLQLKVFVPHLSLALEYQGETHYYSTHMFGKASDRQRADQIKQNFAKQMGITLLSIPFWWDKSSSSLAATIQAYRPDINADLIPLSNPIPSEIPLKFQNKFSYIPNASKEYTEQLDPTGW
jgi:hypothetical protein